MILSLQPHNVLNARQFDLSRGTLHRGRCYSCLGHTAASGIFFAGSACCYAVAVYSANILLPDPTIKNFDKMLIGGFGTTAFMGGIVSSLYAIKILLDYCKTCRGENIEAVRAPLLNRLEIRIQG
ncbi:MAG: hypothetical protein H0X29_02865 [Parachlamydiaceae bacterium]|nr:hypothetical protein [Parachlamydiaceae bacterium]